MSTHPFDILELSSGKLIFTPCPGTKDTTIGEALHTLKSAGASVVVTVMPSLEMQANQVETLPTECEKAGLGWVHLPIEDKSIADANFEAEFGSQKAQLVKRLADDETIAIHCKGGSGRTGLMAAIILLSAGYELDEVIAKVQSIRPRALSHESQLRYLKSV